MAEATDLTAECFGCKAKVALKRDALGRLYWSCNGVLEGDGCGSKGTYGAGPSRRLEAAVEKRAKETPDVLKENPTKSELRAEPGAEPKPKRRGFFYDRRAG